MIIYLTTNLKNGKQYIGRDAYNKPSYLGGGKLIREAVKKYGKENFKKEILEYCKDKNHLLEREEYWLKYYNVDNNPNFYNLTLSNKGWEKGKPRPKGRINSPSTRALISQNGTGKVGKHSGKPTPVEQYRVIITYEKITEFPSIKKAAEQNNVLGGDITAVCQGRQKTAGGYFWKYKNIS